MKKTACVLTTESILRIIAFGFLAYLAFLLKNLVILFLLALVMSILVEDFVDFFERKFKIPHIFSVILLYLLVSALIFLFSVLLVPIFLKELKNLIQHYPLLFQSVPSLATTQAFIYQNISSFLEGINQSSIRVFVDSIGRIFGGIVNLVLIFILSLYFNIYQKNIGEFAKTIEQRGETMHILFQLWRNVKRKIQLWFRGQLILSFIVFLLTFIGLSILRIPYAILLSLVAGALSLIPYGIILAIIPALIISFNTGGLKQFLLVLALYVFIQQITDYFIQPILSRKMTGVPALLVLLSVIISVSLLGVIGVILAVPFVIVLVEVYKLREKLNKKREREL